MLATWRLGLDASSAMTGEPYLMATARTPVARMSPATANSAELAARVTISNDRGALTLPVERTPGMVDGVVWVPAKAPLLGVADYLAAAPGDLVRISPAVELPATRHAATMEVSR
jgi:NADH-quinone oxidoreductase subunit G